jgi:GH43 family beta-xylosidase
VHDVASNRDYLAWVDSSGQDRWASFTDLAVGGTRTATGVGAIDTGTAPPTAFEVGDSVPAGTLVVPDSTVSVMQGRFGRIRNTAVSVPPVSLAQGAVADLSSTRAGLTYSDGSTASRAVSWDPDDLAAVDTARPGSYTVRGTVRTPVYPVPFANNRADPDVYRYERNGTVQYLFMATDDTNNNNIASTHLPIRGSATIAGLSDTSGGASREVDLLNRVDGTAESNTQGKVFAGCYWAPELHEIGGKLSILFAPCFNADGKTNSGGDFRTVQAHIMQLRDGGNPLVPADWSKPAPILQSDGSPLQRSATLPGISLDMSYFEVNGKAYYTWSQRYIANNDYSDPATWIATVDPSNPTKVTSAITPIIQPVYSWEEQLSEGGFAVFHDGRVHLVYSSSGVSPTYVVGGASAPIGADLLDPASWTKENAPLQRSGPRGNTWFQSEQGPGHGAFTTDEDGNLLYVFHTWDDGGRDARLRRAHWAADGHLVLDMTLQEEVAPDLRRVSTTVVVRGTPGVTPGVTPGTTSSTTSATAAESSLTAPPRAASTIKVRQPVAGSSTRSRTARIVLRVPALSRPGGTLRITAGRTKRTVVVRGGTTAVSVPVRAGQRIVARYTGSATALPARTAQAASTGTTR